MTAEHVGIVGRTGIQEQYVAVPGIEGDDRPAAIRGEQLGGAALQVEVDGEVEVAPALGCLEGLLQPRADAASERVDLHELRALLPPQLRLVHALDSGLPENVAGRIPLALARQQLLLADLRHVAGEVCRGPAVGVHPSRLGLEQKAGNVAARLLEHGERAVIEIVVEEDGLSRVQRILPLELRDRLVVEAEDGLQAFHVAVQVAIRSRQQRHRVGREVLGDDVAFAVVHEAARGGERDLAHLVATRARDVLRVLDDLKSEESGQQDYESREDRETGEVGATISTEGIER